MGAVPSSFSVPVVGSCVVACCEFLLVGAEEGVVGGVFEVGADFGEGVGDALGDDAEFGFVGEFVGFLEEVAGFVGGGGECSRGTEGDAVRGFLGDLLDLGVVLRGLLVVGRLCGGFGVRLGGDTWVGVLGVLDDVSVLHFVLQSHHILPSLFRHSRSVDLLVVGRIVGNLLFLLLLFCLLLPYFAFHFYWIFVHFFGLLPIEVIV